MLFRLEDLVSPVIEENSYFSDFRMRLFDVLNSLSVSRIRRIIPIFKAPVILKIKIHRHGMHIFRILRHLRGVT